MIKGSKRDKFSTPEMQTLLEKSRTYSTGSELMRLKCSDDWWSKVLRKSVNLEHVDINFNITLCIVNRQVFIEIVRKRAIYALLKNSTFVNFTVHKKVSIPAYRKCQRGC